MSDLIEREAVFDAICGFCKFETDAERRKACTNCLDVKKIKAMPSARPQGEWIEMGQNEDGTHNVKCNQCDSAYKVRGHAKSISTKLKYRFCPHCGARMKGSDDERADLQR